MSRRNSINSKWSKKRSWSRLNKRSVAIWSMMRSRNSRMSRRSSWRRSGKRSRMSRSQNRIRKAEGKMYKN